MPTTRMYQPVETKHRQKRQTTQVLPKLHRAKANYPQKYSE